MENKFWMILVAGSKGTHIIHPDEDVATKEAERLHAKTGRAVYVLELKKTIK